ncbi:MAG: sigma-70 family RNA polymerase sigma factor [Planctomycetota bacterium]|nr:sigma-70 family RNA polymerase sigma factor [Planctomycetota bacterium]
MHDDEDADLVERFRAGERAALEDLYRRHATRVWRYARFATGSEEAAADVVQETFLRLTRHLHGFKGRARFSTWLFTVARSVTIDLGRRRRRMPETLDEDAMAAVPDRADNSRSPAAALESGETKEAVREAVARLPQNEREAVVLYELQELSIKESCEVLGWSESRMKVTLFRARRRLKEMLTGFVKAESV